MSCPAAPFPHICWSALGLPFDAPVDGSDEVRAPCRPRWTCPLPGDASVWAVMPDTSRTRRIVPGSGGTGTAGHRSDLTAALGIGEQAAQPVVDMRDSARIEPRTALDDGAIATALALMLLAFRTATMVSRQQLADAVGVDAAVLAHLKAGDAR
jgi:hypothetical protein